MKLFSSTQEKIARLQRQLALAVQHFRTGHDRQGLDSFCRCLVDLENILAAEQEAVCSGLEQLRSILDRLLRCSRNQNLTGLADLLEFELYPLTKTWLEGCEDQ